MRRVKVAIIGAGSAGLSAFKEVRKKTKEVVIIDQGPLGTTCARVGCMPSKVLIQVAEDFFRRKIFEKQGIQGANNLSVHVPGVLAHVRKLRDSFVDGVIASIEKLDEFFIKGEAKFVGPNTIKVADQEIVAEKVIIATGSKSIVPSQWQDSFADQILTSETVFEQQNLCNEIAVIGAGVIGLELGQALARLGLSVTVMGSSEYIAGLADPVINTKAIEIFKKEMNLITGDCAKVECNCENDKIVVSSMDKAVAVDKILVATGMRPLIDDLDIHKTNIELNSANTFDYDSQTMQVGNLPIYVAGDVNKERPLLHEAADEGRIAGYNAVADKNQCFKRRTELYIVFTQPNIAIVGRSYKQLKCAASEFLIGVVDFSNQGRARIKSKNQGCLHVYVSPKGKLLGAEMVAPDGEYLAHLLAWAIEKQLSVFEVLQMPYYHPVVAEGLRTALRDVVRQLDQSVLSQAGFELAMCDSSAVLSLC